MEEFVHKGKQIAFAGMTGEVVGSQKFSETKISSSGGGGYVGPEGGRISAPTIRSTSVTNHEIWIRAEDGVEHNVSLRGLDIPLREGQKVTLVATARKGAGVMMYCMLVNHSAGRHWYINTAEEMNQAMRIEGPNGRALLVGGLMCYGLLYAIDSYPSVISGFIAQAGQVLGYASVPDWKVLAKGLAWGVPVLYVIQRVFAQRRRMHALNRRLEAHLERIVDGVLKGVY